MKNIPLVAALTASLIPVFAWGDTLSPSSFNASLNVGGSTTIHKTLTVTPEITTSKVDVVFLFDTTGSMGGTISSAKTAATTIFNNTSLLGDVQFGVAEYKDGSYGGDAFQYRLNSALSSNAANFTAGLSPLSAYGGGDWAESNFYATQQVATTTAWRTGSTRIIIEFGDAPSHDGTAANPTQASVLASLQSNHVIFDAIDYSGLNSYGQATALATGTGGTVVSGSASVSGIISSIQSALTTSLSTYTSVDLDLSDVPVGLTVTSTPGYTGSYTRATAHSFDFDVTITGASAGTYDFDIYGTVGGGRVATERDHIVVTKGGDFGAVPEPSTYGMIGAAALIGLAVIRRKRKA